MKDFSTLLVYDHETSALAEKVNQYINGRLFDAASSNFHRHLNAFRYDLLILPATREMGNRQMSREVRIRKPEYKLIGYGFMRPQGTEYDGFINTIKAFENPGLAQGYIDGVIAKAMGPVKVLEITGTPRRRN
jgi:hypothetical protein